MNMKLLLVAAAMMPAACAETGSGGHKSGPAERACYNAVANRQGVPSEITIERAWHSTEGTMVTLSDASGVWNCLASNDGYVEQIHRPGEI